MKNYFGGRGIQLGSGGKEKRKEKLFDLRKKAAVIKQIQLAAYAEDRKSCWRRNYKQVRANLSAKAVGGEITNKSGQISGC